MGESTAIAWCDHTANLYWGCTEIHIGCDRCYARIFAKAKGKGRAWEDMRFAVGSIWSNLAKWQRAAAAASEIRRVFCGSMMDIGEKPMEAFDWNGDPMDCTTGDLRDRYFREVIPATPNLMHLLLTKRPGNLLKQVPAEWLTNWPKNVMPGTSPANQETADTLVPQILRFPVAPFLSVEPLVGPVDLSPWLPVPTADKCRYFDGVESLPSYDGVYRRRPTIGWVIVGGESQHHARPCDVAWIRSIVRQCRLTGTPCFVKQIGAKPFDSGHRISIDGPGSHALEIDVKDSHGGDPSEWPEDIRVREFPVPMEVAPR